jgi:hypothetical protein
MKLFVIGLGIAGQPPTDHAYAYLWQGKQLPSVAPTLPLPSLLKREHKIQLLARAAFPALEPLQQKPELLQQCGFIVTTRWDGRTETMFDPKSAQLLSFGDLPPSSVALSVVAHVAESCIPMVLKLQGPTLTLSSRHGLSAAIAIARTFFLTGQAPLILVQEFDLALPVNLRTHDLQPQHDYAVSLLLSDTEREQETKGYVSI